MKKSTVTSETNLAIRNGTPAREKNPVLPVIVVFLLSLMLSLTASAQNSHELNQLLNQLNASPENTDHIKAAQISNLVYEVNPTVYVVNHTLSTFGSGAALRVETEPSSFDLLYNINSLFNQAEILVIKLSNSNQNAVLDVASLNSFTNLRYILYVCEYNCSAAAIDNMFINAGNVEVFYLISIPD